MQQTPCRDKKPIVADSTFFGGVSTAIKPDSSKIDKGFISDHKSSERAAPLTAATSTKDEVGGNAKVSVVRTSLDRMSDLTREISSRVQLLRSVK